MAILIAAIFLTSIQTSRYTINLGAKGFEVTQSQSQKVVGRVPIPYSSPKPGYAVDFSTDAVRMTWNKSGLTIKGSGREYRTAFRDVPTSPHWRRRDQIKLTVDQAHTQGRKLTASALSGWAESGTDVYLLVRWQDRPGQAWLEALEKVNLADSDPRPETLAVLPGVTFSNEMVDSKLLGIGKDLVAYTHTGPEWGRWSYSLTSGRTSYLKMGSDAKFVLGLKNGTVQVIEKSSYGSFNAQLVNGSDGKRLCQQEFETMPRFVSPNLAQIVESEGNKKALINMESGAQFDLPAEAQFAPVGTMLLLWSGGDQPQEAWLYEPAEWTSLGHWSSGN